VLGEFNWVTDWFDVLAARNDKPAITIVSDAAGVSVAPTASWKNARLAFARSSATTAFARAIACS